MPDVATTETTVSAPQNRNLSPSARDREHRTSVLAELESMGKESDSDADAEPAKPAGKPAKVEKPDDDDEDTDAPEDDDADGEGDGDEDTEDDDDDDDEGDDDEGDDDEEPDADTKKRLDKVKAAEKRMRAEMQREREELRAEMSKREAALQKQIDELSAFEKFAKRAKYDPVAALQALGLGEADLEDAARLLYAASPAGAKDPKNKDAAARLAKEREERDRVSGLAKEVETLKAELKAKEESAVSARQATEFVEGIAKAVTDKAPLVQRMLEKSPAKAHEALAKVAMDLMQSTGEVPEPAAVIKALEKRRRAELEELGIEAPAPAKGKDKAKGKSKDDKSKPTEKGAKPASSSARGTTREARRAGTLAELEALMSDDE